MNRVIGIAAALQRSEGMIVPTFAEITISFNSRRGLRFSANHALLTGNLTD
ncbi:hypothetical protein GRAN_2731 [Granulicella sibirica]|uniref:Uncharacterized protein n=1 Tax=Granulicella sibirica TaxID=2479048 RepID=A0A4V1L5I4_9BACT|nr:hypothetical protein GRAN_2731 [Granulicella sibirica]